MPDEAGILRRLTTHLVTGTASHFAGTPAGADAAIRIVLAGDAQLDQRLQDQAVGEQQLVFDLEPGGGVTTGANVTGEIDLEPLRRQALDAERQPRVLRARPHIMTN